MRVLLVACGARKGTEAAPLRRLYTGSLCRAAMAFADDTGDPWYIVSAKHGLAPPSLWSEPYDVALSELTSAQRDAWAMRVASELLQRHPAGTTVDVHAGVVYAQPLAFALNAAGFRPTFPLTGLMLGERLHWYSQQ